MSGIISTIFSIVRVVLTLGVLLPGGGAKQCVTVDQCMCQFDDYSGTADLTTCGNQDGTAKFPGYTALYDQYLYSYNPCFSFTENTCKDVSMCISDYSGQSWDGGYQSTTSWSFDGTNVQIYYSANTDVLREVFITAICDLSYGDPFVEIQGQKTQGVAQYYGRITTKCACPDGCHTTVYDMSVSLGVGWIVIIIVIGVGFVYIAVGVLYMRFVRHASGREMIPNSSFWGAIPGLIKDGFVFVFGCIRGVGGSRTTYQKI